MLLLPLLLLLLLQVMGRTGWNMIINVYGSCCVMSAVRD